MLGNAKFGNIGNWAGTPQTTASESARRSLYGYEWVDRPVFLSRGYTEKKLPESKEFADGELIVKRELENLDSMFLRNFSEVNTDYLKAGGFRARFVELIKDPGFLHHVVFWESTKDSKAIIFMWFLHKKRFDLARRMIDGENLNINGEPTPASCDFGPWDRLAAYYRATPTCFILGDRRLELFEDVLRWPTR
ncbi:hypothetical protein IKE71_00245 [Candidatus Saccharibacteria bacterium]|nr:hypothetical protein [Candidatus Saccharibacteria bacterium]